MTASHLTNQRLSQLLSDLGFQPGELTGTNQRVWRHPESGCVLLLPANKIMEAARPADVVGVRTQLAFRGHLDEKTFDDFAREGRLPAQSIDR